MLDLVFHLDETSFEESQFTFEVGKAAFKRVLDLESFFD